MSDILKKILDTKIQEIAAGKQVCSESQLLELAAQATPTRGFVQAIRNKLAQGQSAVIAEIKRASPSRGILRDPFDPVAIAKDYENHGAACLSVLTDRDYFQGAPDYLVQARQACNLPAIRKDFIIDTYQVAEARALGADAILLIVAALSKAQLLELEECANQLMMDVLVEVHDHDELNIGLQLKTPLIGINNRNLRTFETALETTLKLSHYVGNERILVTESGIMGPDDVALMRSSGVNAFLVGEAFMRAASPGQALERLFS
jgi:indole-3-glycerol phosphate synthase